jgi:peptide methionine sulfoxide reductase MsrB
VPGEDHNKHYCINSTCLAFNPKEGKTNNDKS